MTILWLVGIFAFYIVGLFERPASFNELGDFLAGVFAPIAFFWLIMGYVQQGKQLEQNIEAIEQQKMAVKLQIDSMEESLRQMDLKQKESRFRVRPNIELVNGICQEIGEALKLTFDIKNIGLAEVVNLETNFQGQSKYINKIGINESNRFEFDIDDSLENVNNGIISFKYFDILGYGEEIQKTVRIRRSTDLRSHKIELIDKAHFRGL